MKKLIAFLLMALPFDEAETNDVMRFIRMAVSFPRLTWHILRARVQSTRTRMQVLFEVCDGISQVEA